MTSPSVVIPKGLTACVTFQATRILSAVFGTNKLNIRSVLTN